MANPVKGLVMDLATNESQQFALNPMEFEEVYSAVYEDRAALAAPHQRRQFRHTENVPVTMELVYNRQIIIMLATKAGTTFLTEEVMDYTMSRAKAFFESLTSPRQHQGSVLVQSPPTVLLVWPNILRLRAKVDRCSIRNTDMVGNRLVEFRASLEFKEVRERELFSADIRRMGSIRGGSG